MYADLKIFLSKYAAFSDEEMEDIVSRFKIKNVKRNEFLLVQGKICKDLGNNDEKLQYAWVHMEEMLNKMHTKRFEESLRIVSDNSCC